MLVAGLCAVGVFSSVAFLGFLVYVSLFTKEGYSSVTDTFYFYRCLIFFLTGGKLRDCPYFMDRVQARVQLYSLSLVFYLWDRPHYRSGTFREDMVKNLRNVAIPGTGISLRWLCYYRATAYAFLFIGYPLVALVAAMNYEHELRKEDAKSRCMAAEPGAPSSAAAYYREQLLTPQDWFSFWRLNCRLASLHAGVTGDDGYSIEDKWTFIQLAQQKRIAVSPTLACGGVVCKHRNEEGGLGYASFGNAAAGGDWIIQERLSNGPELRRLLPTDAPLSTFRIITGSRGGLRAEGRGVSLSDITALSCVFRAGRAGAITDHVSTLFDVDLKTGRIGLGTTNVHWYKLGASAVFTTPWLSAHDTEEHPDVPGLQVTGQKVQNIGGMVELVVQAHLKMAPRVPLIGWDVALTEEAGMCLLEGNLSCNFFRGTFDKGAYFAFIEDHLKHLEVGMQQGTAGRTARLAATGSPNNIPTSPPVKASK